MLQINYGDAPLSTMSPHSPGSSPHKSMARQRRTMLLATASFVVVILIAFACGWRTGRLSATPQGALPKVQQMQQQLLRLKFQMQQQQLQQQRQREQREQKIQEQKQLEEDSLDLLAQLGEVEEDSTPPSPLGSPRPWCPYGALRGTWVSSAQPGERWRLLDKECQLENMLVLYGTAPAVGGTPPGTGDLATAEQPAAAVDDSSNVNISSSSGGGGRDGSSSSSSGVGGAASGTASSMGSDQQYGSRQSDVQAGSSGADGSSNAQSQHASSRTGAAAGDLPAMRLLLLSDSVDRYITGHLCEWIGGQQQAQVAHEMLPEAARAIAGKPDASTVGFGPASRQRWKRTWLQQNAEQQSPAHAMVSASSPTNLYTTAYSLHKCVSSSPIKIASSYFPGVHPTGPWHRNIAQSYKERIDSAASLWRDYAGDAAPHLVVSLMTDRTWCISLQDIVGGPSG